jgi:integrase
MPSTRSRYQECSLERVGRAKGPDVWIVRWRELQPNGSRVQRKKVIGNLVRLPKLVDAKRAVENLRAQINSQAGETIHMTVGEAWGHFQEHELRDSDVDRSPTTIQSYLDYFKCQILPKWKDTALDDVKSVAVEKWLRSLDLAPATKAKLRNHLSALFSHCIRHELYAKLNPITSVRQSAVRQRDPDILTLEEMKAIIDLIGPQAIRVMVATAAASALRRSEVRGLKWKDLDFDGLWFHLERGLVRKDETKLKTKASRKGVPMAPELAELLKTWRSESPYPMDSDWVFASPFTQGARPYWAESALADHIKPAALRAGITKNVHWHVFRHSFASLMGQRGEGVKTVQELLRHATSRITTDVYQQADNEAKRSALGHMSGMFVVSAAS